MDLCEPNKSDPLLRMNKVESKAQRIKCFSALVYSKKEDEIHLQYQNPDDSFPLVTIRGWACECVSIVIIHLIRYYLRNSFKG